MAGCLFSPANTSLVTLFRNLGLRSLRIGGGSVDELIPAGTGSDGFTGIDNLFAFAATAGVRVIYTLRLLSPAAAPVEDLQSINAHNLTAYCIGTAGDDYVTIINKTHGEDAADAAVTILPPGPAPHRAQVMTLASGERKDAAGTEATLGGAVITGDAGWQGTWNARPAAPRAGIRLTVTAATAAIVKVHSRR